VPQEAAPRPARRASPVHDAGESVEHVAQFAPEVEAPGHQRARQQRRHDEKRYGQQGRHDPQEPPSVEIAQRSAPVAIDLLDEKSRDQETADDEEDIDADMTADQDLRPETMIDQDGRHRHGAEPVDLRQVTSHAGSEITGEAPDYRAPDLLESDTAPRKGPWSPDRCENARSRREPPAVAPIAATGRWLWARRAIRLWRRHVRLGRHSVFSQTWGRRR